MLDVAIMLEGQNGVNWENFKAIARLTEDLGFAGLYRSDHFTNASGPDLDSLELWVSLTWLATHTEKLDFGPLVSPVSFRDPVFTARMGKDVDELSGGRLHLGVGAGWQDREHAKFGYTLVNRFERLEEALDVITLLLNEDDPIDYAGRYYQLQEAQLLPRPARPGEPPILIGGGGIKRTLPLVVRYATMWNCTFLPPDDFAERTAVLDELLKAAGRDAGEVHRSMMTGCYYGADAATVDAKLQRHPRKPSREDMRARGVIVGGADEAVEQLGELAEAGLQRVMLQWLDLDDLDGLEHLGTHVLPQLT